MSNEEPKFMKPGDDPILDRALNELRFDSGLYEAGDYDMFGRRRGLGRGRREENALGDSSANSPPVPAVVTPSTPPAAEQRAVRPLVAALAILSVIAPVAVYASVTHTPRGRESAPAATVMAAPPSALVAETANPPLPTKPSAEPAPSAPAVVAPRGAPKAPARGVGAVEEPRRDVPLPRPAVTVQPSSVPSSVVPPPLPHDPPKPPPEPTHKPVF